MDPTAGSGSFLGEAEKLSTLITDPPWEVRGGFGSGKSQALVHALFRQYVERSVLKQTRAAPWSRIPITPDVELLVNARLNRRTITALEELASRLRLALLSSHASTGVKLPPQRRHRIEK